MQFMVPPTAAGYNVMDISKNFLGLSSNDPKLHFKTVILPSLASEHQPSSKEAFYKSFSAHYHLSSPSDAALLISKEVVWLALEKHPENVHTLIHHLVGRIIERMEEGEAEENATDSPGVKKAEESGGYGFGKAFGFGWNAVREIATGSSGVVAGEEEKEGNKEIMACVRCLSRLVPIIYEYDAAVNKRKRTSASTPGVEKEEGEEEGTIEEEVFWTLRPVPKSKEGGKAGEKGRDVGGIGLKSGSGGEGEEVMLHTPSTEPSQFIIDDDDDDEATSPTTPTPAPPPITIQTSSPLPPPTSLAGPSGETEEDYDFLPPLGSVLPPLLLDLLFLPTLATPHSSTSTSYPNYTIWEPGLGSSSPPPSSSDGKLERMQANRVEIMHLLLLLLSKTLYQPEEPNMWIEALYRGIRKKATLALLCSLLNTSIRSLSIGSGTTPAPGTGGARRHERQSSGVLQMVGGLAERVRGSVDKRQELGRTALLLLGVLITEMGAETEGEEVMLGDNLSLAGGLERGGWSRSSMNLSRLSLDSTRPSESRGELASPTNGVENGVGAQNGGGAKVSANPFLYYLSKLHRSKDFTFLLSGLFSILHSCLQQSVPTILNANPTGGSQGMIVKGEALLVLWKLVTGNKRFETFLLESGNRSMELAVYLIYFALEAKDDVAQFGLVRLSIFFLQTLSAERAFGSRLNTRLNELKLVNGTHIKGKWATSVSGGTVADFLIVSVYNLMFSTKSRLSSLYPALSIILSNTSPFWKNLSVTSSTRLIQIFLAFSNPAFILQEEGNPRLVYYTLEAFNNIIQFALNDNPHVIYSILRSHRRFEDLGNFTLARAASDIHKQRAEQKAGHRRRQTLASLDTIMDKPSSEAGEKDPSSTPPNDNEKAQLPSVPGTPTTGMGTLKGPVDEKLEKAVEETLNMDFGSALVDEPMSEKKRGKMREIIPEEEEGEEKDGNGNGRRETSTRWEGKNGFVATEDWVASWREGLPLDSILIMISELYPKVSSLSTVSSPASTQAVLDFLRTADLSGILPQPSQPFRPRPFLPTPQSEIWSTSLVWGWIYVSVDYFRNTIPNLFTVEVQPQKAGAIGEGFTAVASAGKGLFERVVGQANAQQTQTQSNPTTPRQNNRNLSEPVMMTARRQSAVV
ncbi:hypothetical protein BT69DRAFT_1349508 [Atractiella rhizophila]|nr:hypothetical protein BT69DRAFT_1349508 [Atractiella rhizophila]